MADETIEKIETGERQARKFIASQRHKTLAKNRKSKHPHAGHPCKYTIKEILHTAHNLAEIFCATDEAIASYMEVSPRTFLRWKRKHPELCRVIQKGKERAIVKVQSALFDNATKHKRFDAQAFILTRLKSDVWPDRSALINNYNIANAQNANNRINDGNDNTPEAIAARSRLIDEFVKITRNGHGNGS